MKRDMDLVKGTSQIRVKMHAKDLAGGFWSR